MKMRTAALLAAGAIGVGFGGMSLSGCNSGKQVLVNNPDIPQDVDSIIFLQRTARQDTGNVFEYNGYVAGARLLKLSPPAADGTLTELTSDPRFKNSDIMAWDLSFDARTVVFSARLATEKNFQLYAVGIDGLNVRQLTNGPYDYVFPVILPGQRVLFTTNKVVEEGAKQFRDEYERATTSQVGTIGMDGKNEQLGPRNVSHRVSPALMPDGNIVYTEWRHLGGINDGHLRKMNTDMTGMREAFGGEGNGITNSYLKARFVDRYTTASGKETQQLVAVATSRDRTLQAGKLVLISLGDDEASSKVEDLTPLVPGGRGPSQFGVGRYYDAEPLGNPADRRFLVSWADGPVNSEVLAEAKGKAEFGIYVYDAKTQTRRPIYDAPGMWDVMARPVRIRPEPPITQSPITAGKSFTLGALNVYASSTNSKELVPGEAFKVRLIEGFSSEEGFPNMFGLTEFDGQSNLGEVDILADNSFAAHVPANVPVTQQVIDRFAMSMVSEKVWISGRAGEQRVCGGCHENRSQNTLITGGLNEAIVRGATNLDKPRAERITAKGTAFTYESVRGVPWDLALQPIFDAKCVSCHEGTAGVNGNKTYTITDMTLGTSQTVTFDLRGTKTPIVVGEMSAGYDYPASYISMLGLGEELGENVVTITGEYFKYVEPGSARESKAIQKLNPPQRFPAIDPNRRAFPGATHPADRGGQELTPDEYYLMILNFDMGGQYYFRENNPGNGSY
ncbi:MAG: hypothetical protein SGI86_02530 [Deltaproteobacteria bacterium]|nr:hypothetical protein [Deltaproteobacteria bacterium]